MAAGVSLQEENVEIFRKTLNVLSGLTEKDFLEKIIIDVPMPISYINKNLIQEMSRLEPFGKGNEKPVFAQKGLKIAGCRVFGKNRNVVKMQVIDSFGYAMDAVYFGEGDTFLQKTQGREVSILYYPEINNYMGRETIQIVIKSYQ